MRRFLIWTEADFDDLTRWGGLSRVLTEVDGEGSVTRELGYDAEGSLIHRHPGEPTLAKYGLFDLAKIASSDRAEMESEEFERLWSA